MPLTEAAYERAIKHVFRLEMLRGDLMKDAMTADEGRPGRRRDPEDRIVDREDGEATREKMFDKTMADSFPASDPPSSIPDPSEDSFALGNERGQPD